MLLRLIWTVIFCFDIAIIGAENIAEPIRVWIDYTVQPVTLRSIVYNSFGQLIINQCLSFPDRCVTSQPCLMLTDQGGAVVVWESYHSSSSTIYLEAAVYAPANGWSSSQVVSDEGDVLDPGEYDIQLGGGGDCNISWKVINGSNELGAQVKSKQIDVRGF